MKEFEEQRVCVKFCRRLGKNVTDTFQSLKQAYGEDCMKGSPRPKKARMSRSKIKVLFAVFFDWKGVVHHEFVPRGQMVNKQLYQDVLERLRDAVRRKRPELWEKRDLDVAPRQCAGSRVAPHPQLSGKNRTSVIIHPPYSPDLAPADFFLFPKLKTTLKGRRFQTIEEIHESDEKLVHVLSSADVARRLMLIAKRDKWQFVVKI